MKSPDKISRRHMPPRNILLQKDKNQKTSRVPHSLFSQKQFWHWGDCLWWQASCTGLLKTYRLEGILLNPAGLWTYIRMIFAHKYFLFACALPCLGRKPRREVGAGAGHPAWARSQDIKAQVLNPAPASQKHSQLTKTEDYTILHLLWAPVCPGKMNSLVSKGEVKQVPGQLGESQSWTLNRHVRCPRCSAGRGCATAKTTEPAACQGKRDFWQDLSFLLLWSSPAGISF